MPAARALATVLTALAWRGSGEVTPCEEDTFGMAGTHWKRPYEAGVERLTCDFRYTDAAKVEKFVLNYYPSIDHFADYNGTDMVPERHFEYRTKQLEGGLQKWIPGKNGPKGQVRRIQLGECDIPQADGGAYSIQRVGPLVSTGNYDYWQYGWHDLFRLSRLLRRHPEGIMFTAAFSGPVDPKGRVLGHPPIHIHHIHITPAPGVVTKMNHYECATSINPKECYVANLAIEQHGDYQCTDQDGGVDCFFEETADGYAKVLTKPIDLEGEINDVRAPNSEPMTWWYQVILRWFPRTHSLKPLSQHFRVGPGLTNRHDQRHNVLVFPVNTTAKSVYWYTGKMGREGIMLRNKLHAHNTMFDRAFWFRATARDLGIDGPEFWPKYSFRPLLLDEIGYTDFEAFQGSLLTNLQKAAERWDRSCPPARKSCADLRPALVCQSWVSNEDFVDPTSGRMFAYDRRAPCCCRPWHFQKGDVFTVVAFMAPMKTPPGPWMPDRTPPTANMHIHWVMTYDSLDNKSHYEQTNYCQNPNKQIDNPEDLSRFPMWTLIENAQTGLGGMNNLELTIMQRINVTARWILLCLVMVQGVVWGTLVCCLMTGATLAHHLLLHCRRTKHVKEHPAVVCAEHVPCCTTAGVQATEEVLRYAEVVVHEE